MKWWICLTALVLALTTSAAAADLPAELERAAPEAAEDLTGGDLSGGDRLAAARAFAAEHGCVLVLKGHRTITAFPDGEAYVNTTGNPGMAKGGSGDVLSGIILSLLGQGFPPRTAEKASASGLVPVTRK